MVTDTPHFRYPLLWVALGCSMIGLVVYFSLMSNPPSVVSYPFADKSEHLLAYGLMMGWFCQLYASKKHQLILAVMLGLMGISLEILQGLGGHRFFEYTDMVANVTGVSLGWWLSRGWCAGWLFKIDQALSR